MEDAEERMADVECASARVEMEKIVIAQITSGTPVRDIYQFRMKEHPVADTPVKEEKEKEKPGFYRGRWKQRAFRLSPLDPESAK